ncbi:MAG: hypothetical protein A2268_01840 [Candidatus Raymondbacteria bacterium RifOxyA12_full_50_37]|uniref:Efflux transporter periplasmic adaptor subunit n=1 Tax=Candidatus Raymondbacteria bacterium RIFOXYD12_FULL_49_13 TaxID=1817890 RepID=A0A1F7FHA5_UNCRA|nr:MAG: hypothetical protein A2268_01840 [Candidatus Raymondbacteria bacterium RifOxyA12_full_50_37]OGJ89310.1 MAG: hypothetical protein A2248_17460 [Candidatus Raymondbacteria bacterium RIFOXYA2_FULL_49_16]OGK00719.1 MAG: hypothetical protein A2350_18080 [Candidatus Raymondbacteria bacterium RifOxyB12_full_50_8]OGK04968.1 MAG: hypothetical protein A2487_15965 [Candidatus Raymondbacteria bacterium RifOxyC12_full_50_8]OGK06079.1 MAG: hypothetical protein A2519_06095 [Candidatus Raymondbacteria b
MKKGIIAVVLLVACVAGLIGFFAGKQGMAAHHDHGSEAGGMSATPGATIMYYRCPMHPWITSGKPSKCPICSMDLVPVSNDGGKGSNIKIDAATIQAIGVTSEEAGKRTLVREIRMPGIVQPNERKVVSIVTKVAGYIEKAQVNATGEKVRAGQTLFDMYSPDWVNGQEDFLRALKTGDSSLAENARQRLLTLDVPASVIDGLRKNNATMRRLPFVSPASGVVTEKMITEGQSVSPGMPLYTITDLSEVWVMGEAYQNDLAFIAQGQKAEVVLDVLKGKVFSGTIALIYPELNPETRTGKVRIALANTQDLALKPGMTGLVTVMAIAAKDAVAVPEQAVIHSGRRDIVVLDLGNGYFAPREVMLGPVAAGYVQVITGVQEHERVVTSSQFLIDSESNLREAVKRLANMQTGDTLHGHPENFTPPPVVSQDSAQRTCPIMGGPINKKMFVDYKGKRIYVCCARCLPDVKKNPEKAIKTLLDRGEKVANAQKNH